MKAKSVLQLILLFFFTACVKEDYQIPEELIVSPPMVNTAEVTDITAVTAKCGGEVTNEKWREVTARGVCWSTSPNPTVNNSKTTDGSGLGAFTSDITGLTENTTYYVRAYATNEKGTAYGEERSFTTIPATIPTVTTNNVSSITATTAVCGGNVTDAGNLTVTARGVCWNTSPNPTIDNSKTTDESGTGAFTSNITGLTENTTYYVRAYATNAKGTAYGEEKSFTTLPGINGYAYVDLGLPSGLKWATYNIGATTSEEYGDYYAWGETTPKTEYTEENSVTSGLELPDISGNPQYDAARANWGSTWRMPTKEEMEELENNCTWTWITQNGVNGMKVVGSNGNSIFLPASGGIYESLLDGVGLGGNIWTSTPDPFETSTSYTHNFYGYTDNGGNYNEYHSTFIAPRDIGYAVRPVSD